MYNLITWSNWSIAVKVYLTIMFNFRNMTSQLQGLEVWNRNFPIDGACHQFRERTTASAAPSSPSSSWERFLVDNNPSSIYHPYWITWRKKWRKKGRQKWRKKRRQKWHKKRRQKLREKRGQKLEQFFTSFLTLRSLTFPVTFLWLLYGMPIPLWNKLFFLLAGHKVDFIAPCGSNKSTFWPASRKKIVCNTGKTFILLVLLLPSLCSGIKLHTRKINFFFPSCTMYYYYTIVLLLISISQLRYSMNDRI